MNINEALLDWNKQIKDTNPGSQLYELIETELSQQKEYDVTPTFGRLQHIENYLPYLTETATKLYMFYVLQGNNKNSSSYWSIEKLADKLNVVNRSIQNANRLLVSLGLIYRTEQQFLHDSVYTTILPAQNKLIRIPNGEQDPLIKKLNSIVKHPDNLLIQTKTLTLPSISNPNNKICYTFYKITKSYVDLVQKLTQEEEQKLDTYLITMYETPDKQLQVDFEIPDDTTSDTEILFTLKQNTKKIDQLIHLHNKLFKINGH